MALTGLLNARAAFTQTGSNDLGTVSAALELAFSRTIASGTGANQADLIFADTRTITASSSENLDLRGSLTDAFGATLSMVELVAIIVTADSANTNNVVLGDATNPIDLFGGTNPTFSVKPGGMFMVVAPNASGLCAVDAGSGDVLKVANSNSGTSVTYSIIVVGRSA